MTFDEKTKSCVCKNGADYINRKCGLKVKKKKRVNKSSILNKTQKKCK